MRWWRRGLAAIVLLGTAVNIGAAKAGDEFGNGQYVLMASAADYLLEADYFNKFGYLNAVGNAKAFGNAKPSYRVDEVDWAARVQLGMKEAGLGNGPCGAAPAVNLGLVPMDSVELADERGAGLDAQAPAPVDDSEVAVILWDEFRRPPGGGGSVSYSDATSSQIASSINGSSF
jgi:hypothetical protein